MSGISINITGSGSTPLTLTDTGYALEFVYNNQDQVVSGGSVIYKHTLTNQGLDLIGTQQGELEFSVLDSETGFHTSLYYDANNNGILDASDINLYSNNFHYLSTNGAVGLDIGESITLFAKVLAPVGVLSDTINRSTLVAFVTDINSVQYSWGVTDTTYVVTPTFNKAPIANNDQATAIRDQPITINVLANDSDPDGDTLVLTQASISPDTGQVVINPDNTITFTPNQNFIGQAEIQYTIADSSAATAQAALVIDVKAGLTLTGDNNNNVLEGSLGDDVLIGLDGDDSLIGLPEAGDSLSDYIIDGNDALYGGTGNDYLVGLSGDDVYAFNLGDGQDTINNIDPKQLLTFQQSTDRLFFGVGITPNNVVVSFYEDPDFGNEAVKFSIKDTTDSVSIWGRFAELNVPLIEALVDEVLFMDGTIWTKFEILGIDAPTDIIGDSEANTLPGTLIGEQLLGLLGNDTLFGNEGNDTLIGGLGDDVLSGDEGQDVYVFNLGDGQDVINTYEDFLKPQPSLDILRFGTDILPKDIQFNFGGEPFGDDLIITIKNTQDQITVENYFDGAGNNQLVAIEFADGTVWNQAQITEQLFAMIGNIVGTLGADNLQGGIENNTYQVNHQRDQVLDDGGIDTVEASVSHVLSTSIENLTLVGTANLSGTGNGGNNIINGNSGKNRLLAGDGNDEIYGFAGSDTLDGGTGADTLFGGLGNDVFVVDNIGDVVVELAQQGFDSVNSWVSYTLTANVERLNLEGVDSINGIGNELDNIINGNSGNNHLLGGLGDDTLEGKGGKDTLEGGLGDDIYYIDNINDVVVEQADAGIDKVSSSVSYSLSNHVEQLFLTGSGNTAATGNNLDNIIYGNDGHNLLLGAEGNDSLNGGMGNDTLDGGAGNDTLVGGLSDDIYLFGLNSGRDIINNMDALGNDKVLFDAGIQAEQVWLRQLGDDLEVSIIGTANSIKIQDWYSGDATKRIDSLQLATGNTLLENEVQTLVNAMAAFVPPPLGQTSLSATQQASLGFAIAVAWEITS